MKKYYIVPGDCPEAYKLFWTTDEGYYPEAESYKYKFNTAEFLEEYPNAEQITRKQAIAYARAERKRRKENGYFSGRADKYVHPYGAAWYDPGCAYLYTDSTCVIVK